MTKRITTALLVLAGLVAVITWLRRDHPDYLRISGAAQGTSYSVTWESRDGSNLQPVVGSLLRELDASLSTYRSDSIISRINANDPAVPADRHVLAVMEAAVRVHRDTGGAFDPTIAPVVRASGFGPDAPGDIDPRAIEDAMKLVGLGQVSIVDGRLIKARPEIRLDLNGIAQGYSVDVISRALRDDGLDNFMVEIGGEVFASGVNASGREWRIGIDRPDEGNVFPGANLQAIVLLRDRALATSGNYRNYRESGGRKFTHLIDPRTGRPTESPLLSVTVTAPNCTVADACATACMVMGLEEAVAFIEARDDLEALFIHADASGTLHTLATKGLAMPE